MSKVIERLLRRCRFVSTAKLMNRALTLGEGVDVASLYGNGRHPKRYAFFGNVVTEAQSEGVTVYDLETYKRIRRVYHPQFQVPAMPHRQVTMNGDVAVYSYPDSDKASVELRVGDRLVMTPELAWELSVIYNGYHLPKEHKDELTIIRKISEDGNRVFVCLDSDLDEPDFWFEVDLWYPKLQGV